MDREKTRRLSCTKLTEKQVAAAAARHELLYSGRVGGARAVFAFCDLSGLDLSGRNLADADFTGAYLEETNLAGAKLDSASFFGASLQRANLSGASLRRADMRGTSLRGAKLIGADMYEADLREGRIAERDHKGSFKILQHDVGPTEMPAALMASERSFALYRHSLQRGSDGGFWGVKSGHGVTKKKKGKIKQLQELPRKASKVMPPLLTFFP